MKRASLATFGVALLGGLALAGTAAGYVAPKQAKKMSVDLVTAYNQCTAPTLTHRQSLALPACIPVESTKNDPTNVYEFGTKAGKPDGSMSVSLRGTYVSWVGAYIKMTVKSKSIIKNGAPYTGDDLTVTAITRLTDNGCFGGSAFDVDCTVIDLPFVTQLECTNGSCTAPWPPPGVHPAVAVPLEPSNIDIGQIAVLDEDGDEVFRSGLLVL